MALKAGVDGVCVVALEEGRSHGVVDPGITLAVDALFTLPLVLSVGCCIH